MKKQGIIFDFNGTLFWDTKIQNDSWDLFLEKYGFSLTEEEKVKYIHGINAKDTFEYLFKRECDSEEVYRLTEEKEVIYRKMCLEHGMQLAPGAQNLFEFLIRNKIPIGIATAAAKNNVDFFSEHFKLLNYFKPEHIIYNDGTVRGKPHPDLFIKAINALGLAPESTTIFEDSHAGLKAAQNAGAGQIVIVNSVNGNYSEFNLQQIKHFDEFDRSLLLN